MSVRAPCDALTSNDGSHVIGTIILRPRRTLGKVRLKWLKIAGQNVMRGRSELAICARTGKDR